MGRARTVNDNFRRWDEDGTLDRIQHKLYVEYRELAEREAGPFLPVPEAMLEGVTLVLQNGERLILDVPPCPATGGEFDNSVGTNTRIGDEAVAIRRLVGGIDQLYLEPVDHEPVLAVPQRDVNARSR